MLKKEREKNGQGKSNEMMEVERGVGLGEGGWVGVKMSHEAASAAARVAFFFLSLS